MATVLGQNTCIRGRIKSGRVFTVAKEKRNSLRKKFEETVMLDDEQINLAEAALLIAAEEYPSLDISLYLEKIDRIGDLVRERASQAHNSLDILSAINATLFDGLGFRGNVVNYYDPRNSFLNEVIDRHTGIPITLTVLYMEVARRVGLHVEGVGMPGHFIAKLATDDGELFIDTFNGGRLFGEVGCADLLSEMSGGTLQLKPEHLAAVTKKQILERMLSNLMGVYAASDHRRALAAIERILLIKPDSPPHIRDRGLLLATLGRTTGAITELERYLMLAPDSPDADSIREQIKTIRQSQAKLN
jgi:regulator of sirC expression with transglutaminase-like and TPR domain